MGRFLFLFTANFLRNIEIPNASHNICEGNMTHKQALNIRQTNFNSDFYAAVAMNRWLCFQESQFLSLNPFKFKEKKLLLNVCGPTQCLWPNIQPTDNNRGNALLSISGGACKVFVCERCTKMRLILPAKGSRLHDAKNT